MEQQSGNTLERKVTESSNIANSNEAEQNCRDIVLSIKKMKEQLLPPINEKCNIFRVPKRLLSINPKAYTPQVISIGPFYHRTPSKFMATDQHKLQAFNSYLGRVSKTDEAVVKMAQKWENKARGCYAEPIKMKSDKFIIMLLLDGCFIVEFLLLHSNYPETKNGLDPSFYKAMSSDIYRDLTMLENQLPFFVLQDLFDQIPQVEADEISLVELTHDFFSIGLIKGYEIPPHVPSQNVKHLLDLLSFYFIRHDHDDHQEKNFSDNEDEPSSLIIPPSVTELHEAGVKIRKAKEAKCLMDISFKNGVLEIPPLDIDDHFETNVRNLMAFEHYRTEHNMVYPIQYAVFFDDLISTEKDVRLLVKAGIITNNIGSNEKVSRLFNNLCKYVTVPNGFYYLNHISKALREHCNRRNNKRMASLKRNHCNTPWAVISILAATFLIILTLLQTIFTGITTFK